MIGDIYMSKYTYHILVNNVQNYSVISYKTINRTIKFKTINMAIIYKSINVVITYTTINNAILLIKQCFGFLKITQRFSPNVCI